MGHVLIFRVLIFRTERADGWYVVTRDPDDAYSLRGTPDDTPFPSEDEARHAALADGFTRTRPFWIREAIAGVVIVSEP